MVEVGGPGHSAQPSIHGSARYGTASARDEVLLDVEDVAAGHQTKLRWNDSSDWIWSTDVQHEALVSSEDFAAVQAQMAVRAHRPRPARVTHRAATLLLAGLVRCTLCGRRMQGHWNHDLAHYRCRYPAEYALANKVDHPKTVYLPRTRSSPSSTRGWPNCSTLRTSSHVRGSGPAGDVDEAAEARRKRRGARWPTVTHGWPSTGRLSMPAPTPMVVAVDDRGAGRAPPGRDRPGAGARRADDEGEVRTLVPALRESPSARDSRSEAQGGGVRRARACSGHLTIRPTHCAPLKRGQQIRVQQSVSEGGLEPLRPCGH